MIAVLFSMISTTSPMRPGLAITPLYPAESRRHAGRRFCAAGLALGILLTGGSFTSVAAAQEKEKSGDTTTQPAAPSAGSTAPKPKPSQAELEATFKETLTQAVFSGRWCAIKDGKLSPEKEDKYTIVSVNKLGGDAWIVRTRIQYGNKDFVAPIPIQVKWAGDTPVITLDDVGIPGSQSYSARVLVYGKTYAGTWSGSNIAGLLSGVILKDANKDASAKE
jgi:hypothetical protein